jgi:hypothetical protein
MRAAPDPGHAPFVIIGAGGHASVVTDLLQGMGVEIRGLTDQKTASQHATVLDVPILGDDSVLERFGPSQLCLANGLGIQPRLREGDPPDPGTALRRGVFEKLNASGYSFPVQHVQRTSGRTCCSRSASPPIDRRGGPSGPPGLERRRIV